MSDNLALELASVHDWKAAAFRLSQRSRRRWGKGPLPEASAGADGVLEETGVIAPPAGPGILIERETMLIPASASEEAFAVVVKSMEAKGTLPGVHRADDKVLLLEKPNGEGGDDV